MTSPTDDERRAGDAVGEQSATVPYAADDLPRTVVEVVAAAPEATLVCDPDSGVILAANRPATRLFDRDPTALSLVGVDGLGTGTPPPAGERVADRAATAREESVSVEWTVDPRADDRRHVEGAARLATIAGDRWLVVTANDVTDRVRMETELRSHRRVTDAVASTLPAALVELDAGGTLSRWNQRFAEDAGREMDELAGRSLTTLFEETGESTVGDALTRVYGDGDQVDIETTLLTRTGKRLPYRLTLGPITDHGGAVIGAIGVGEDRTEWSLREQRLSVLTRVLRHNFRNDLNVILGFGEQALASTDDEQVAASLRRVLGKAEGLLRVGETSRQVERLLDEPQSTGVHQLDRAVDAALDAVDETLLASAEVTVDVPTGIAVEVVDRFPEAVAELVDNAIRHSTTDRPRVRIHAAELPSESWVTLSVADDGPGIPSAERAVLTGAERQLDHASGLGLWYVNWVVTAGGGSLSLADSKAGGARVDLSLRLADGTE